MAESKTYRCKHCGKAISFSNRMPYNLDGSRHLCLSSGGIPCNHCGAKVNFRDGKPVNLDGSEHRCIAEARQRDQMMIDKSTGELIFPWGANG